MGGESIVDDPNSYNTEGDARGLGVSFGAGDAAAKTSLSPPSVVFTVDDAGVDVAAAVRLLL
uniref:Uncharacterized protein n=1 Tax=Romanomermis culicivorax TaxID=13658 RepID=A0A915KZR8_ROMCU